MHNVKFRYIDAEKFTDLLRTQMAHQFVKVHKFV